MKKVPALLLTLSSCILSFANIRLPSVISSDMVLQQQSAARLWGWADPGEKIYVTNSWNNKTDSAVGSRDATWQLTLNTPAAGGPYTITLKGYNTIVLNNVMIGEVWVCSGQSNMEMNYSWGVLQDVRNDLPKSYNPNIRFFHIPRTTAEYPQDNCEGKWAICDSNSLKTFSAAAYYFGKKLNNDLHVPIGLINSSWGGTPAEVWTPAPVVDNDAVLKESSAKLQAYNWWPYLPGKTYNAMIAPLTNFAIAGAIWYQGEGNTGAPNDYSRLLNAMIDSWRKAWNKDFPFYYVQIAPYNYGNRNVGALIQEQQAKSMSHDNVGMIVITDLVNDTNNIHPTNKHDVGIRLANYALGATYKEQGIAYKYPVYKSMTVEKGKAVITFDNAMAGLMSENKTIAPIYIAGSDKIFYPAEASIDGNNKLEVWSKQVKEPVAVRYAFGNTAIGNLFSKEGLPVCPFRTDDWPVDTSEIPKKN